MPWRTRWQLRTPSGAIAGVVGWLAGARSAGADPLDGLAPAPAMEAVILVTVGLVIGGPWVAWLWMTLRRSSRTVRRMGALYAIVSGVVVFRFSRDLLWASIVALPSVPLLVERSRVDAAFGRVRVVLRALWRMF